MTDEIEKEQTIATPYVANLESVDASLAKVGSYEVKDEQGQTKQFSELFTNRYLYPLHEYLMF